MPERLIEPPGSRMPTTCTNTYVLKKQGESYVLARYEQIRQEQEEEENFAHNLRRRDSQAQRMLLWRRDFVIDPEGDSFYLWSGISSVAVVYNFWAVIIRIAFAELREEGAARLVFCLLDICADVIYLLDLVMQFRRGYLAEGILVRDPLKLAENYMRGRRLNFLRDMLSALPLANLLSLSLINSDSVFYPMLRLPKLIKWHTLFHFLTTWDMKTNNPTFYRACKLLVYLATTIHWIGCFYKLISEYEGVGSNAWVLQIPSEKDGPIFARKYLCSMYWSTMTLTTIGNDASPITNLEYLFTGCTFLIGVFLFATVVGNVGDVISNMNAARVEFQQRMDSIKLYMKYHKIPVDVQDRVKKWAEYSWNRTQAMDDQSHMDILPFRLKAEIAKHVHLEALQKVKIFEECEKGLLCELVVRLRSQIYSPGDYICRKGEIGREMYIINHGKVEVLVKETTSGESTVVATLTEGNYFGEISLLKLEQGCNRRTADVRSVGYSELLVLSKRDLHASLVEYPDARCALERQARDRMHQSKEAIRLQRTRRDSTLRVSGGPHLQEDSDGPDLLVGRKGDPDKQRIKEKEMSEVRHVLRELRAFDSQATKMKMQGLTKKCSTLEAELRKRCQELEQALARVSQLELQLAGKPAGRNGVCKDIAGQTSSSPAHRSRRRLPRSHHHPHHHPHHCHRPEGDIEWTEDGQESSGTSTPDSSSSVPRNQEDSGWGIPNGGITEDNVTEICDDVTGEPTCSETRTQRTSKVVDVMLPGITVNDEIITEPRMLQMTIWETIKPSRNSKNYANSIRPTPPIENVTTKMEILDPVATSTVEEPSFTNSSNEVSFSDISNPEVKNSDAMNQSFPEIPMPEIKISDPDNQTISDASDMSQSESGDESE